MEVNAQGDCVLKKDQDKIRVYNCPTEGSAYKTVKAEFTIDCSVEEYLSNAVDVDHYKDWHFREVNPTLLERISDTELIYYTEVSAPFPVSNRDLILHLSVNAETSGLTTIKVQSEPDYLPEKSGRVRVRKSSSIMRIHPIEPNKLKVEYQIQVDPAGSIPSWLVNLFSTQGPYESFRKLIERLESKSVNVSNK